MNIIEADSLTRRFDSHVALDGVSFSVQRGSVFGFLGRNGAGKTTAVKIITGIVPPTSGGVKVFGRNPIYFDSELGSSLGVVSEQTGGPKSHWRGTDYLRLFAALYGLDEGQYLSRLEKVQELVELDSDLLTKRLGVLSSGERKRVEICRSLLHSPRLLILDEPTKELDILGRRHFWSSIKNLVEQDRLTVFLCSHDPMEIQTLCTDVAVIKSGRLTYQGSETDVNVLERYM
jgi:ABC-2 type transport system ATP-binding protein